MYHSHHKPYGATENAALENDGLKNWAGKCWNCYVKHFWLTSFLLFLLNYIESFIFAVFLVLLSFSPLFCSPSFCSPTFSINNFLWYGNVLFFNFSSFSVGEVRLP